jgi:hypothetical protein
VPDADIEAEIQRARERYGSDRKLIAYFESERGRGSIRSSLRRTRLIEGLIDEWLAAHPDFGPLPHLEDAPGSAVTDGDATALSVAAGSPGAEDGVESDDARSQPVP